MKAVILAGGLGTRLSEETVIKPKPMVEIGGRPILWHIMKIYAAQGITDFVICCGYKGFYIKEYFANYYLHSSDMTFDLANNRMEVLQSDAEPWRVTLVNTGQNSGTGGRLLRIRDQIGHEPFFMTYGDGVSNVDLKALLAFHQQQGLLATLTAVQPPGRFGAFRLSHDATRIEHFREKPKGDGAYVNGGFFVLEPGVLDYIEHEGIFWEAEPLSALAEADQLAAYKHDGFWYAMDTLRDRNVLEAQWAEGSALWKIW
jgi:glucose-1-phosphate cytidylyltransferase